MKPITHIVTILVAAALLVGVPVAAFADWGSLRAALTGDVDAVSSSTVILDAPSGSFTVYINKDRHADAETLANWECFFAGEEVPLIMEDISCVALQGDAAGVEMAQSLQSRLPTNQMKLRLEDPVVGLSKAEAGRFDALVVSDEIGRAFSADTLDGLPFVDVVRVAPEAGDRP